MNYEGHKIFEWLKNNICIITLVHKVMNHSALHGGNPLHGLDIGGLAFNTQFSSPTTVISVSPNFFMHMTSLFLTPLPHVAEHYIKIFLKKIETVN
jgi:hypothetical protein